MSTCGVASVCHLECLLRAYVDWYYLASCVCNTGIKFVSATKLVIVAACNLKLLFLGASVGYHCVTIQHTYKMKVTDGHHILPKKMNCMANMHASRKVLVQNKVA